MRACGVFQRVRPLLGGPVEEVPSLHQAERRCARHRVSAQPDHGAHVIAFLISGDFSFLTFVSFLQARQRPSPGGTLGWHPGDLPPRDR